MNTTKKGVILLNMGGPDSLADVEPFLFNLFSDRQIIRLGPPFLQKFLAKIISRKRAPKSRALYKQIGGSSPLKTITREQADALSQALSPYGNFVVSFAMRYWPPYANEVVQEFLAQNVCDITALSLYPHYSKATTGSSISHLQKSLESLCPELPVQIISSWPAESSYIKAIAENIQKGLCRFEDKEVTVVYSAHSLPTSFIDEGDPYVEHINQTIQAVEKLTEKKGRLCYQSRSGPVEWLSPSTPEMIEELAGAGCTKILMVPISFVSDHVETLYEIGIQYRNQAKELGIELHPCDSLNTQPLFIHGLRDLVLKREEVLR